MGNAPAAPLSDRPTLAPLLQAVLERDMPRITALLPASSYEQCRERLSSTRDKNGRTALILACGNALSLDRDESVSRVNLVGYLIARGASVESEHDASGWTPLHHACATGDLLVVRLLMDSGAAPQTRNWLGIPALDFLERSYIVPGHTPLPAYVEQELSMNVGTESTSRNKVNRDARCDCELSVPEVTYCGDTLSVIVTSARPTASLPKSYYAQLYYVDSHRPWVMRKRIGSYRYITSAAQHGNANEESDLAQSTVLFGTAQLTPGAKFRVLLHTGRGGKLEVLCASNVVTIRPAKRESVSASSEAAALTVQCPVNGDEFDVALDSCSDEAESLFWVPEHDVQSEAYHTAITSMTLNSKIWVEGLRSPPPDSFLFDLLVHKVDVELALEKYPRLMGLRFRLVPCWMDEGKFWRIFFYQVALLRGQFRDR